MLYIVRNFRTRPTHLTTYWDNIRGIFNPALINRVNKLITYNCHTFLESSGQVHQTIDVFIVFITHSDELFEFMRISQDDIENGDKIDVINEVDTLDLQIYFCTKLWLLSMLL